MIYVTLIVAGAIAWFISTIAAGGGAILLVPLVSALLGAQMVAPVVTVGTLIAAPSRAFLFWQHIDWRVIAWQVPGTLIGAILGSVLLVQLDPFWIKIFIGVFLISTLFQFSFGNAAVLFPMRVPFLLPIGILVGFISGMVGAVGPILNPFYLNVGLVKEKMIATKALNSVLMQSTKIGTYTLVGVLTWDSAFYGVLIGAGAVVGTLLGKKALSKMPTEHFLKGVVWMMVVCGVLILYRTLMG